PLLAFSLLIMFIAFIIHGGAAVVGISASLFFFLTIIELLEGRLAPVLINSYFNTLPIILDHLTNPVGFVARVLFVVIFGFSFYLLSLYIFTRKDMVY
ncbi:MAG: hypothetical protein NUK65_13100, partial [Firmicutes bacterium]|nr:hypothetical protein [Bacillota bacterium]